ncbi:MAG: SMP-30/gluconolactonase/LRE family protein [Dehalococcoidia bacterium]|nr:SMP-30/gluconolactonase/LRE family protein [Dehalococcoidia bacterium]
MERLATGFALVEGPVWDPGRGLIFSDVHRGGVHCLAPDGTVTTLLPKRKGVGGMAPHAAGGLVIGGRDISFMPFDGTPTRTLLSLDAVPGAAGFNDLTTDAAGRVYVGSVAFAVFGGQEPKPGWLHVIELDGTMRTVSDGILLTNGLGFSPDGKRLYHSDARAGIVRVYDMADDGTPGPWQRFAGEPGLTPDGLAVAADGSVWVALAHSGCVAVFEPDGRERMRVPVPLPMVTSVCFGGPDLQDLYIVTGSGDSAEDIGSIFRTRVDVPGLAVAPARVAVPA